MSKRPVLRPESFDSRPVTEDELDVALAYAAKNRKAKKPRKGARQKGPYIGQKLNRDLLRILANSALERRKPGDILALLAANVVREAIPQFAGTLVETEQRYEGFKSGVMKIMSIRRVWQIKRDAERKERGLPIPARPKQTEHPEDETAKLPRQLRLFS